MSDIQQEGGSGTGGDESNDNNNNNDNGNNSGSNSNMPEVKNPQLDRQETQGTIPATLSDDSMATEPDDTPNSSSHNRGNDGDADGAGDGGDGDGNNNWTEDDQFDKDREFIRRAEEEMSEQRLLNAARLLKHVQHVDDLFNKDHHDTIRWATAVEEGMKDLLESPEQQQQQQQQQQQSSDTNKTPIWKKQCERHGHRDFFVYYHVNENRQLTTRIDAAVESSLLVPILSVFNESELHHTWMPSTKIPMKIGLQASNKLKELGRGNQIIQIIVNMAWPYHTREIIQHAVAVDVIDEQNVIAIQVQSETNEDDPIIPEVSPNVVRVDFESSMLIRACPLDHPVLTNSKKDYPPEQSLFMFSIKTHVDAHVSGIPLSVINFISRTFLGRLWSALLQVAEDVRDGKRPLHKAAIEQKRELYDWVEQRTNVMFDKVKTSQANAETTTATQENENSNSNNNNNNNEMPSETVMAS